MLYIQEAGREQMIAVIREENLEGLFAYDIETYSTEFIRQTLQDWIEADDEFADFD